MRLRWCLKRIASEYPGAPPLTPNAVKAILQYSSTRVHDENGVEYSDLAQGAGSLNAAGAIEIVRAIDTDRPVGTPWLTAGLLPVTTLGNAVVAWSQRILWRTESLYGPILDSRQIAWALDTVWGSPNVWDSHIVWGTDAVWGDESTWGTHIVWGDNAVGASDDGDHIVWGTTGGPDGTVWGDVADPRWRFGSDGSAEVTMGSVGRALDMRSVIGLASFVSPAPSPILERRKPAVTWGSLPLASHVYVVLVTTSGGYAMAASIPNAARQDLLILALLAGLSIAASMAKVSLPVSRSDSTLTVCYVLDFTTLLVLGPYAATLTAGLGAWSQCTTRAESARRCSTRCSAWHARADGSGVRSCLCPVRRTTGSAAGNLPSRSADCDIGDVFHGELVAGRDGHRALDRAVADSGVDCELSLELAGPSGRVRDCGRGGVRNRAVAALADAVFAGVARADVPQLQGIRDAVQRLADRSVDRRVQRAPCSAM